ncbi:uncharacterized protein [Rutidosis leptorrhynchoides]|uniref:uncharacterized protein n=1 Tax=Rutidosis leptorrhynchoides TaxID=125765 RepID=UPI003A99E054
MNKALRKKQLKVETPEDSRLQNSCKSPLSTIGSNSPLGISNIDSVNSTSTTKTKRIGRPPKYKLSPSDTIPFSLENINKNAGSLSQPSSSAGNIATKSSSQLHTIRSPLSDITKSHELPIKQELTVKRRGRPPKYKFSDEEMIPLDLPDGMNDNTIGDDDDNKKFSGRSLEYRDLGDPIYICTSCKARLWKSEAMRGNPSFTRKAYSLCCLNDKVELPPLNDPPQLLLDLFTGQSEHGKNFMENIRRYNMIFSFTSIGGKIDHSINNGNGPYVYRMQGQNYHLVGSLLPEPGQDPRFCQLYIYDTGNEVDNSINSYGNGSSKSTSNQNSLLPNTVHRLKGLLDHVNPLVKKFRMARDRFDMDEDEPIQIKLIGSRAQDGRTYNLPTANEVAAIIIGDIDGSCDKRDIVLDHRRKGLRRISELHPSYLALQYPLLFPYAQDGYRVDILHKGVEIEDATGHARLTLREFFAYRLQMRVGEKSLILMSRKLLQQFMVDAYTMVENTRLHYIRNNQKAFRVAQISSLHKAQETRNYDVSAMGTRITLPSSFTGGARYMYANYMDAMAIVRSFGPPDLFITLTSNPKWPEVLRVLAPLNLNPEDRPDIVTRVFKMKLYSLYDQIKDEKMFGYLRGGLYVIEFQKRGLPHVHMILWLDETEATPNASEIDRFISAEIPDKDEDPELYSLVSDFMMHGPCGEKHKECPCMRSGTCSKGFPKDFTNESHFDADGFPVYKRRNDGNFIMKKGEKLDNRLSFHLPNQQPIVYDGDDCMEQVINKPSVGASQFIEWMKYNEENPDGRQYTYVEFPRHYVWNATPRKWSKRQGQKTVARLHYVHPKSGEAYYLRIMLNKVRGPTCYEDLRTIDGIIYDTFKEACYAMGLLDDDKEYIASIKEVHQWSTGNACRSHFVSLITTDSITFPDRVWKETCDLLSDDLAREVPERLKSNDPETFRRVLHNISLSRIEKDLNSAGYSLRNIPNMPFPDLEFVQSSLNMLIQDEISYDIQSLNEEHQNLKSTMTDEQNVVYDTIVDAVYNDKGGLFFLYGYGGTGKTFVWKTLAAAIRSRGDIVINVASSGIAALLLTGGRTAHSRFAIPINVLEDSFCSIQKNSDLAAILNKAKLIIWDEAPMMHKHCFEAFDRTMRDIIVSPNRSSPFGGKVVVFGGDFRQILPVIQRGTRSEIVHASLHSSDLWRHCKVLKLTKNMRLRTDMNDTDQQQIRDFADWILKIGEGKINEPNDGEANVEFPMEMLLKTNGNAISTIVNSTYPEILDHLGDGNFFSSKAILAPTNEEVDSINDHILSSIDDEERVFLSSDSLTPDEENDTWAQQVYSPEVLNGLKVPGVPNHRLTLKRGVPIMLLRNMDQSKGLCNGTRLLVERIGDHTIEARIITGHFFGNLAYISRMVIAPTDRKIAVKFQRRQFPITVCFAMTINKSQGQSLSNVGLYLRKPVFSHGQLYVAISRVTSKKGLKAVILDDKGKDTNITKNVSLFKSLPSFLFHNYIVHASSHKSSASGLFSFHQMNTDKTTESLPINNDQHTTDESIQDEKDASEQLRKKRARSAEASRRCRDRQKIYVDQLEKLIQDQKNQIETLIQTQIQILQTLDFFFRDWSKKFDNLIATLQRQMYVNNDAAHISPVIQLLNDHYLELLNTKKQSAKKCVMSIIDVKWLQPTLSTIMWIGGIRPSDIIKLILNHIELSTQQLAKIENLKLLTLQQETQLINKVHTLKHEISETFVGKSFVDKGDTAAMSNYTNNMFEQIGRLSAMENYLSQADTLRATTYKEIQTILTLRQTVMAFYVVHKHVKRLQSWNNLWESRPEV